MAMTMNGEVQLAAPREVVWAKLNDRRGAQALHPRMRGAQQDLGHRVQRRRHHQDRPGQGAVQRPGAALRHGPAQRLQDFRAKARAASPASPRAAPSVKLTDKDGGTLLALRCRVADRRQARPARPAAGAGAAKKLADDFFNKFAAAVAGCPRSGRDVTGSGRSCGSAASDGRGDVHDIVLGPDLTGNTVPGQDSGPYDDCAVDRRSFARSGHEEDAMPAVSLTVNGKAVSADRRAAHPAGAVPAREPAADRHPCRLRHLAMRLPAWSMSTARRVKSCTMLALQADGAKVLDHRGPRRRRARCIRCRRRSARITACNAASARPA